MGASEKYEAAYHGLDDQTISAIKVAQTGLRIIERLRGDLTEEPTDIDVNSLADWLCEQFEVLTEEGGNDLQGEHVKDVTFGGRIVTVEFTNGQQFRVEVWRIPGED